MEDLAQLIEVLHHQGQQAAEGVVTGHRRSAQQRIEAAHIAQFAVASQLAQQGCGRGVLEDDAGQHRVPCRSDGVVITATASKLLEQTDKVLIRKHRQHQAQAVQIAVGLDVLPTEHVRLYDRRHLRPFWLGWELRNPFDPGQGGLIHCRVDK